MGTVFVHAGIGSEYASLGCDGINQRAAEELGRAVPRASGGRAFGAFGRMNSAAMLEDPQGPVWYRGLAENPDGAACAELGQTLARMHAQRMVVGAPA